MGPARLVTARIELDIEPGTDPIRGTIGDESGAPARFVGWLELIERIEAIREDKHRVDGRATPPGRSRSRPGPKPFG
jgi:hypothetical protein